MSRYMPTEWDLYHNPKFAHKKLKDGTVTLSPNGNRLNANHIELLPWYHFERIAGGNGMNDPMSSEQRDMWETRIFNGEHPMIYLGNDGSENGATRWFYELTDYAERNGIEMREIFEAAGYPDASEELVARMNRQKILNRQIKRLLDIITG